MQTNTPNVGKFSLNYGFILGLLSVAFNIMLFIQDAHTTRNVAVQIIGITLMVGVIMVGIFNFRKANEGFLTLSEALKIGTGVALISGIMAIIWTLLLVNYLDPEFAVKIAEAQKEAAIQAGTMSDEQIQQQYDGTINYFWIIYPFILISSVLTGFIIGLIGGLIFKKARPAY